MKRIRIALLFLCALLVAAPASAQLNINSLKNKAKNAIKQEVAKQKQKASGTVINAVEGNDKSADEKTDKNKTTATEEKKAGQQTTTPPTSSSTSIFANPTKEDAKPVPAGPEVPELLTLEPSVYKNDATDAFMDGVVWSLRDLSQEEAKAMAEKLSARAEWDNEMLADMDSGERQMDPDLFRQLEKELSNWMYFYVKIGELTNFYTSLTLRKDANGEWTYQNPSFTTAMIEAVMPRGEQQTETNSFRVLPKDGKFLFHDSSREPTYLDEDELDIAKKDVNMMWNIAWLFEGFPLEWCRAANATNGLGDQFDKYHKQALAFVPSVQEAINANSLDLLVFHPMPKGGSMNASLKAKALAAEKAAKGKDRNILDVVITSDSWSIERNPAGNPVRRVIYGYSIVQLKHGKRALPVSWAEEHQGGGNYGALHAYGVGAGGSYYVK